MKTASPIVGFSYLWLNKAFISYPTLSRNVSTPKQEKVIGDFVGTGFPWAKVRAGGCEGKLKFDKGWGRQANNKTLQWNAYGFVLEQHKLVCGRNCLIACENWLKQDITGITTNSNAENHLVTILARIHNVPLRILSLGPKRHITPL